MKKLLFVLLGIMIALSGWSLDVKTVISQIDVKKLDAGDAKVKLIGPDKVYVGGIGYDGKNYAVVGVLNDNNELSVEKIYAEDDFVMTGWDDIDTSQSTLLLSKSVGANYFDTLTVGNILVNGKAVVVGLKIDLPTVTATMGNPVVTGNAPMPVDAQAMTAEIASLKKQLEERRKELSEAIRQAKSFETKFTREAEIGKKNRQEAFTLNRKYGQALETIDELTEKIAGMEKYVKELEAAVAAGGAPVIDKIVANLKASKLNLSKTYIIADADEITAGKVGYDGAYYDVVLFYDDAAMEAKITKIIDSKGVNILRTPFNFGWGQYRVGAVGYLTLRAALNATKKMADAAAAKIAETEKKIAETEKKVAEAEKMAMYAERKAETAEKALKSMAGTVTAVRGLAQYNKVIKSGFSGASQKSGTWPAPTTTTLTQTDTGQYYAKYVIPVKQMEKEILYSVAIKGVAGNVKQGAGLHFLASGAKKADTYGYGVSYLVWVTKDPKHSPYSSSNTYVQLYQSVDDGTMVNLASVALKDDIAKGLLVQALYQEGNITVYVNGEVKFSLPDGAITSGGAIALRTMKGPITFSELSIKTK
jgi:translation initiation factor 1 (eIF-1/SUI1)